MVSPVDVVRGNTLARQIAAALTDQILSGELAPGTRLKDNEVAAQFGTSNTPVREALRELAKEGLVEVLPYRGCIVHEVKLGELVEIFDICSVLEPHAARLAASRLTAADLEHLEAQVKEHEAALAVGDYKRANEASTAFHSTMIAAAGNKLLAWGLQYLHARIQIVRRAHLHPLYLAAAPAYRPILEALRARDAERAAALMAGHVAFGKARTIEAWQARHAPGRA